MQPITEDLLAKLRARTNNVETRTDAPPLTRGKSVSVGNFSIAGMSLPGIFGSSGGAQKNKDSLNKTLDDKSLAESEKRLGIKLPDPLVQLYKSVADGGFGPGGGLLTLKDSTKLYHDYTSDPPGENGQAWPAELFPITQEEPGHLCINIQDGKIFFWDPEELDEPTDAAWKRSFKSYAESLGDWLATWLDSASPEDQLKQQMESAMRATLKQSLDHWRSKTPQERADAGLPEMGWEKHLFGHMGINLDDL